MADIKDSNQSHLETITDEEYESRGESIIIKSLQIKILEGKNLVAKDCTGYSDPYVKFKYKGKKYKTKICKQTLNPVWQDPDIWELNISHLDLTEGLVFDCWDKDYVTSDDYMGRFIIYPTLRHLNDEYCEWVPLKTRSGKRDTVTGEILAGILILGEQKSLD
eukprot:TRINITY_DN561_c0_g1_i3.p1 TRINITY_DN561_c0_g1~~TRINITY_DN561_c0_g1_i3.p1  ORF type:complete len:163 (-),score=27.31 TRINITY_DN561_c0_g1_i3:20-508(-)